LTHATRKPPTTTQASGSHAADVGADIRAGDHKPIAIDAKTYRRVLGTFATGVTVVTTARAGERPSLGVTINSLASVSLEPPMVLFCLGRKARTAEAFSIGHPFAVNILDESQEALSGRFASPDLEDRWEGVRITHSPKGCPLFEGALAWITCETAQLIDGGDHVIVLGRVTDLGHRNSGLPLLFFRGQYQRLAN